MSQQLQYTFHNACGTFKVDLSQVQEHMKQQEKCFAPDNYIILDVIHSVSREQEGCFAVHYDPRGGKTFTLHSPSFFTQDSDLDNPIFRGALIGLGGSFQEDGHSIKIHLDYVEQDDKHVAEQYIDQNMIDSYDMHIRE